MVFKSNFLLAAAVFLLAISSSANAALVTADATADPTCGAGDPNTCSLTNLSQNTLSGFAGDTFEFIYTLNDLLKIQLGNGVNPDIGGILIKNPPSLVWVTFDVTMALSDINGNLLTAFIPVFSKNCTVAQSCEFSLFPGPTPEFDNLLFHGAHFIWTTSANTAIPLSVTMNNIAFKSSTGEVVPVPAAVWLFGSGLIGLIGIARRKKV